MRLAHTTANSLHPKGKAQPNGSNGWVTCCPVHGDKNPSMSIKDTTDKDGNPDVIVSCHAGCDWKDIKKELRNMGLLPEWKPKGKKKSTARKQEKKPAPAAKKQEEESEPKQEDKEKDSFIWKKAKVNDAEIEKYFSARAINFNDDFSVPPPLRWNVYTKDKLTSHLVVAAATKPSDESVKAVQRLFINVDNDPYKKTGAKMLGSLEGRGIWFYRKESKETLAVGEGIETTQSVMQATGMNGVATLSTSGLKNIIFPDETKEIFILVDEDIKKKGAKKGYAGQKASLELADRAIKDGIKVWIVTPSDTCFTEKPNKKDFNDLLQVDRTGESILARVEKAQARDEINWEPPGEEEEEKVDNSALLMMLKRFVYMRDGNRMIDLEMPPQNAVMKKEEFMTAFKNLGKIFVDDKMQWAVNAFIESPGRKDVVGERYHPGKPRIYDESGVNYFNPFHKPEWKQVSDLKGIEIVKEHFDYLFPGEDQSSRFLAWAAWTVHKPEVRIKFTPLLISREQGTGRGFLVELLQKLLGIWNCSAVQMDELAGQGTKGQYHNYLYQTLFTSMPEVKVGREKAYEVDDAIREKLTEEFLPMNLKYGSNGTYPVFTNFLMASNHQDALVLTKEDRRIDVFQHYKSPLTEDYYNKLYAVLESEELLAKVYWWLEGFLNTPGFNPKGRAVMSPAKRRLIGSTKTDLASAMDAIGGKSDSDLMSFREISDAVANHLADNGMDSLEAVEIVQEKSSQIQALSRKMFVACNEGKKIRYQGNATKIYAVRNFELWADANLDALKTALTVKIETVPF